MADDLVARFSVEPHERNPLRAARREMLRPLPQRFYAQVGIAAADGGFAVTLDGKTVRTPLKHPLVLPARAAAEAVAAEWTAQTTHIDPATMPMTRIVNSAIDGVSTQMAAVRAEIVKFSGSDLVCYRAADPQSLTALEAAAWDPVLAWARDAMGAELVVVRGITFAPQPMAAIEAITRRVEAIGQPLALACVHTMTTLTGSVLLALAVAARFLVPAEAWAAAHVDEDFQIRGWGEDHEAALRRAGRWREMEAAAGLHAMVSEPPPAHSQMR